MNLRLPQSVRFYALLLVIAGCSESGPQLMPVTGRVMLDGQPVPMAEVQFQPEDNGSPSYAVADNDGRYELGYKRGVKGAMVGWHTIRIESATIVEGPNGKITNRPQIVPPRYNDSSELRREVRSDEDNVFDFELTSNAE